MPPLGLTQNVPLNIRPQVLAAHGALCGLLNGGAARRRDRTLPAFPIADHRRLGLNGLRKFGLRSPGKGEIFVQVHGAQFSATRTLAQHFHETKFVQTLVPHRKTGGATCGLISTMDGAEINYRRLLMLIDEAGGGATRGRCDHPFLPVPNWKIRHFWATIHAADVWLCICVGKLCGAWREGWLVFC